MSPAIPAGREVVGLARIWRLNLGTMTSATREPSDGEPREAGTGRLCQARSTSTRLTVSTRRAGQYDATSDTAMIIRAMSPYVTGFQRRDREQHGLDDLGQRRGRGEADRQAQGRQAEAFGDDASHDLGRAGAEGEADADLAHPLRDERRDTRKAPRPPGPARRPRRTSTGLR